MGYNKEELLSELHRCYEENGEVRASILNDSNNSYPSQPTYANHFGSLTKAKQIAEIEGYMSKQNILSIIEDIVDGENELSLKELSRNGVSHGTFYNHFNSIDEALSLVIEEETDNFYRSKYLSIIETLDTVSVDKINNCDELPSYYTVAKYFDGIEEIKSEVGINTNTYIEDARTILDDYSKNINYKADGFIYCYQFKLHDEKCYYIGETTNLLNRISSHIRRKNIHVKSYNGDKEILCQRGAESDNIDIQRINTVIELYEDGGESIDEFTRRRLYREHKLKNSIVLEKESTNVYGGR